MSDDTQTKDGCRAFAAAAGWGLWHKNKRCWVKRPFGDDRMEFETRKQAEKEITRRTRGKRDVMTNYFRISVAPRRLSCPNDLSETGGPGNG